MKQILTVSDVAKLLRLSKSSIYKYAEKGEIPSIKIGTNLRFIETQLDNFLSKNYCISKIS
jgi:PTS system nitrogen regulatory IIA component